MKKVLSILLVLVMSLSLCACGEKNDTSSTTEESITTQDINMEKETTTTPDTNTENETTTTPDYASELTDILCSGKWVSKMEFFSGDVISELTFNTDGTFALISDEGRKEATWSYHSYYDSCADLPLPISAVLCEDFCAYWGKTVGITGHHDIVVGYNEEGAPVMSFDGQSWIKEE